MQVSHIILTLKLSSTDEFFLLDMLQFLFKVVFTAKLSSTGLLRLFDENALDRERADTPL